MFRRRVDKIFIKSYISEQISLVTVHAESHFKKHYESYRSSEIITWFAYSVWVRQLIQLGSKTQRCLWAQIVSETEREFHTSNMADAFNPNSFTLPSVHNSTESVYMMTGMQRKEGGVGKDSMSQLSELCEYVYACTGCLVQGDLSCWWPLFSMQVKCQSSNQSGMVSLLA